jgi:hypothetical protein
MQQQSVIGVKQCKSIGQGFNRIAQTHPRRIGIAMGGGHIGIGLVQTGERIFQRRRPVAHHGFQRNGRLEHRERAALNIAGPFHPVDQRLVDLFQLLHALG